MQIGVFDSGKGGHIIAERLQLMHPELKFLVADDPTHVPYGSRSSDEITALTENALQPLIGKCPIIIIACNTATVASIKTLRKHYPSTKFIGIEPMIKPAAAATKSGHITILATPHTLNSQRYKHLKQIYAKSIIIDEPDTSTWAKSIEDNQSDSIDLSVLNAGVAAGSDVLVLACTHYIALLGTFHKAYPAVRLLEPTGAISRQLARLVTAVQR